MVNGLRYKNLKYTEKYLRGGTTVVSYNPHNVSKVWMIQEGDYEEFPIIEEFFEGMDLESVKLLQKKKIQNERQVEDMILRGSVDLSRELEIISKLHTSSEPSLENVRQNRMIEVVKEEYSE